MKAGQGSAAGAATPASRFRNLLALVELVWRADRWLFSWLLVSSIAGSALQVAMIGVNASLLGLLAGPPSANLRHEVIFRLAGLAAIIVAVQVVTNAIYFTQQLLQMRATHFAERRVADAAARSALAQFEDTAWVDQLQHALREAASRPMSTTQQLLQLFSGAFSTIAFGVVVFRCNPFLLGSLVTVSAVAYATAMAHTGRVVREKAEAAPAERKTQYLKSLLVSEGHAKEIRIFGLAGYFLAALDKATIVVQGRKVGLLKNRLLVVSSTHLMAALAQPIALAYVALATIERRMSIMEFGLYSQAIVGFAGGANRIVSGLTQVGEGNALANHLFALLGAPLGRRHPPRVAAAATGGEDAPAVEFRNVSFRYPGAAKDSLTDVSFRVPGGSTLAIVGENGAGKSTVVKLLGGLYRPTHGAIFVDGIDIASADPDQIRRRLGMLLQDFQVYNFSVGENVGLGRVEAVGDRDAIRAAAGATGLTSVVDALPAGFDTLLGKSPTRGHDLSGGQRQLLALTRTVLRGAPILVLDEPTAAMDIRRERKFYHEIIERRAAKQTTTLLISHRLSATRMADSVLLLSRGTVVAHGNHHELVTECADYEAMVRAYTDPHLRKEPEAPCASVRNHG